jgi:hypothetical protein
VASALRQRQSPPAPPAPAEAPTPVGVDGAENPPPGTITIQRDGQPPITIDGANPGALGTSSSRGIEGFNDIPPNVYSLAQGAIISFAVVLVAFPVFGFLKALVNRRAVNQQALPSRDTTDRLQRIEAAVEAMSEQVERISEGQRFVTKVLAERSSASS